MKYEYKQLDIQTYINSLYSDGLNKSLHFNESAIKETISTYFLLEKEKEFENSNDLENKFIQENFKSKNEKMQDFILNCMRKR